MAVDIIGIDVGTVSVKYLRWGGKGKGKAVSSNEYAYKGDWDDLQRILADIRAREAGAPEVAIAITSQEIVKKTFTIPILAKNELKDALAFAAAKLVSVPLEEMIYHTNRLGEVEERNGKKDEFLFIGAATSFIDRIVEICKNTGLTKIRAVTDTGLLYLPLLRENGQGSTMVIDVGGRQTGIYIVDGKDLRFAREIMTASESFSDALMNGLGLSAVEAEEYKQKKGFNTESADVLALPLDRLVGEVQRTINVYRQRYPERPLGHIYVTGRGARMPDFLAALGNHHISEEINILPVPAFFDGDMDDQFVLCSMLCTQRGSLINLLSQDVQSEGREETSKKWIKVGSVALCLLLVLLTVYESRRVIKAGFASKTAQTALAGKTERMRGMAKPASLAQYEEVVATLKADQKRDRTFLAVVKYLSAHMPKNTYLKDVEFNGYRKKEVLSEPHRIMAAEKEVTAPGKKPELIAHQATTNTEGIRALLKEVFHLDGTTGKESPKDGGQPAVKEPPRVRFVSISGSILGSAEGVGLTLMELLVELEKSGFVKNVEVVEKEVKDRGPKKVMEFIIEGQCLAYEI